MTILDEAGYPTDEFLSEIENFNSKDNDLFEIIRLIGKAWGDGFKLVRKFNGVQRLELHTNGWSGNEEIISVMLNNCFLTDGTMVYTKWERGGHYYFEIKVS
jgi:hypothetical protein